MLDLNNTLDIENSPFIERKIYSRADGDTSFQNTGVIPPKKKNKAKDDKPSKPVEKSETQHIEQKDITKLDISAAPIMSKINSGVKTVNEKIDAVVKSGDTKKWYLIIAALGGIGGYFVGKKIGGTIIGVITGGLVGYGIDVALEKNSPSEQENKNGSMPASSINLGNKVLNNSINNVVSMIEGFTDKSKPEQAKKLQDIKDMAEKLKTDENILGVYNAYVDKLSADERNAIADYISIQIPSADDMNKLKSKYPKVDMDKMKLIASGKVPELQNSINALTQSLTS